MQGIPEIFGLLVLILSVTIHEVAHGYAALYLGDPTARNAGRLTLNPIKHIDPVGSIIVPLLTSMAGVTFGWAKPVPINPYNLKMGKWGPAIVAAVGPLSNLFLALVFSLVLKMDFLMSAGALAERQFFLGIVVVNVVLFAVNIIPIPPIDGSRILEAIMYPRWHHIYRVLEENQLIILLVLIVTGFPFLGYVIAPILSLLLG